MDTRGRLRDDQCEAMPADAEFRQQLIDALPALRRFALTYCRSRSDADDLVQSTAERALVKHQQWSRTHPLRQWLFSILRNQWRDLHRRKPDFVEEECIDREVASRDTAQDSIEVNQVHELILDLPEIQREVLLMVAVEGMSYRDTANCLDLPIGTVMSRLARARATLAMRLGARDDR